MNIQIFRMLVLGFVRLFFLKKGLKVLSYLLFSSVIFVSAQEHSADIEKLNKQANKSRDLYVEPEFNFLTYKKITVDLQVLDSEGEPVQGVMLMLSAIPEGVEDLSDERLVDKSIFSIVRTDSLGKAYQQIEIPLSINAVFIELNMLNANSQVIMDMYDTAYIQHVFELQ